jgi:hypothetical protein
MSFRLLSQGQAAKFLDVGKVTLIRHRKAGRLPAINAGVVVLYYEKDLAAWRDEFISAVRARTRKDFRRAA